jgi:hypothetical protein
MRAKRGGCISGGFLFTFSRLAPAFSPVSFNRIAIDAIANPIPSFKNPKPSNGIISVYDLSSASLESAARYESERTEPSNPESAYSK